MPELPHQTIRLDKGAHRSPDRGMCAVELASVLAGEKFTDHPGSVCPVIAAFARAYNDRVDHEQRQALVPYAARIVGTRGDRELERARAVHCAQWTASRGAGTAAGLARGRGGRFRATREHAAVRAAGAADLGSDDGHPSALALLDELIALGRRTDDIPNAYVDERVLEADVPLARAGA